MDFFSDRKHSTIFQGLTSEVQDISASMIQGSAVGPVSYIINASDLSTVTPGNCTSLPTILTLLSLPVMLSPEKQSLDMSRSLLREII